VAAVVSKWAGIPVSKMLESEMHSMAAPNVANLAAKLFAIAPSLTPPEVIALIDAGCEEKVQGEQKMRVVNPRRSVELLRARAKDRAAKP
jgi:hypothetical protein